MTWSPFPTNTRPASRNTPITSPKPSRRTDDSLIERYLSGEEIPRSEFIGGVKKAILAGQIVPLFCGSGEPPTVLGALLEDRRAPARG